MRTLGSVRRPTIADPLETARIPRSFYDKIAEFVMDTIQRRLDSNAVAGMGVLRRRWPVLRIFRFVLVTRRDDVRAVLADSDTFALPYVKRLPVPFLLGQTGTEYRRNHDELVAVIRPADYDAELLRSLAHDEAEKLIEKALRAGEVDVCGGFVHPALNEISAKYLGVGGPNPQTQLSWGRDLFEDIFLNILNVPSVRRRAHRATDEMLDYVELQIAARKAVLADVGAHRIGRDDVPAAPPGDVLARMLARQQVPEVHALTDTEIRNNIIGLAIGWLWHGARAAVIGIDELLNRPDTLVQARAAAKADDMELLRRLLWEVLRFRPVQAGLFRMTASDATLAAGTTWERRIRSGTKIFVGTHSAMWDETAIPDTHLFDHTRADGQYLIFGDGLHRCFGEQIMKIQLPVLLAPLLRNDGLRRLDGRAGRLRYKGPCPDGLRVRLSAS